MDTVKPIYKKLLVLAAAIYVIGVSLMLSDLYYKVINLEDALVHMSGGQVHKH